MPFKDHSYKQDDSDTFYRLREENIVAYNQAQLICNISESHLFVNTKQQYFSLGEKMYISMLEDLKKTIKVAEDYV